MKSSAVSRVLAALALAGAVPVYVHASDVRAADHDSDEKPLTIAVFGDWPYNQVLLDAAPLLVESVNSDPRVRRVIHIGDIHSGSQPCTGAGLDPLPSGSLPNYNKGIFDIFQQFEDPFVYTPGDNEWTDCHKNKESNSGAPLNELAAVRGLFFPNPGETLGLHPRHVATQAEHFGRVHPTDAQFVENVLWEESRVVFVTVNLPGSNNDGLAWTSPFTDETARTREAAQRTLADLRWIQRAFALAKEHHAKAVLIGLQADMFDPAALVPGADGLGEYATIVHELASLALDFERPVLLINGDSHVFGSDHPLADPSSATGRIYGTPAVPNLTRVTVQGSTTAPAEWLRLTIDPRTPDVFSWENVVYCATPTVSCP